MAGKDRGAELPRRVPGTAPAGPPSPVPPVLPEELRMRMLAAVTAERTEAAAREQERAAEDQTTGPPRRVRPPESAAGKEAGPETSSPASGTNRKRKGAAAAEPAAGPERITGSVPEDDVTGWPGSAVKREPAVRPSRLSRPGPPSSPGPKSGQGGQTATPGWGSPGRAGPGRHRYRVAGRRRGKAFLPLACGQRRRGTPGGGCPRAGCRLGRRTGQPGGHRVM